MIFKMFFYPLLERKKSQKNSYIGKHPTVMKGLNVKVLNLATVKSLDYERVLQKVFFTFY